MIINVTKTHHTKTTITLSSKVVFKNGLEKTLFFTAPTSQKKSY